MQNFVFHNPTKIIFGRNTIPSIGPETAAWGKRCLLVYGTGSIRGNGVYDAVQTSLREAGLEVIDHGGVRSNPLLSHVREGIAKVGAHSIDVVTAVGGGSVIDSAKAICAGSAVDHDVWKFFTGKKSIKHALPLTTVLTLAASGSEMNSGMVITNDETREKFGFGNRLLYPRTSILDPEATFTVPPSYTAYGAVDSIAHVLEYYMTSEDPATPVQDRLMEGLVRNAMDACDRCLADRRDYQGRADLMWTATLSLNGLTGAGLGRVGMPMHMIEHSLSALYDAPHGAGLSAIIPGWLRWRSREDDRKIIQLGERVFNFDRCGVPRSAAATIHMLEKWFVRAGCPVTLDDLNIPAADIPAIAENAVRLARVWRLERYSRETIAEILSLCLAASGRV
ncbi:MAG: iron-containing alcohol dehydrogenase [Desulfobulbaceae bacterium]|jgi:alcohol dehydrogenase YqhD (iron-dependent ADH family)|nr:iron-containing alcohol dehydrogenase [Desulfobulbaceae bacterium]